MSLPPAAAHAKLAAMRAWLPLAFTLASALALGGAPVRAADTGKPAVNRVDLNKVGLPVVWRGRLVNYVFVTVRLRLAPGRDGEALRAKEPYFRDALVRLGHRTPFGDGPDLSHVDERAIDAAMLREAQRVAGPGAIVGVEVLNQQPRRYLPRPGAQAPQGRPITP